MGRLLDLGLEFKKKHLKHLEHLATSDTIRMTFGGEILAVSYKVTQQRRKAGADKGSS